MLPPGPSKDRWEIWPCFQIPWGFGAKSPLRFWQLIFRSHWTSISWKLHSEFQAQCSGPCGCSMLWPMCCFTADRVGSESVATRWRTDYPCHQLVVHLGTTTPLHLFSLMVCFLNVPFLNALLHIFHEPWHQQFCIWNCLLLSHKLINSMNSITSSSWWPRKWIYCFVWAFAGGLHLSSVNVKEVLLR